MKARPILASGMALMVILLLASLASAQQSPYGSLPNWKSADDLPYPFTTSVALGDLQNQGHLDLVVGKYKYPYFDDNLPADPGAIDPDSIGGGIFAYHNVAGTLDTLPTGFGAGTNGFCVDGIALGDCNNDGYLDIAVGCVVGKGGDGGARVFYNQRTASFAQLFDGAHSWSTLINCDTVQSYDCHCVRWVDLNGDGWLDLAALEVPGTVRLYLNSGDSTNRFTPQVALDFYTPLLASQTGNGMRDLATTSINYPLAGTTMEFGDLDGDGYPDLYLNLNSYPTVYKNMCAVYPTSPALWFNEQHQWLGSPKMGQACASFGRYRVDADTVTALAIGSGSTVCRQLEQGNTIYVLDGDSLRLKNHSNVTTCQAQMATDLQWGRLQPNPDGQMDLVAVAYPWYHKNANGTGAWRRGYEQVHLDPDPDNPIMPTDLWTQAQGVPDLSTSLALGDLNYHAAPEVTEFRPYTAHNDSDKFFYVADFPFARLMQVAFLNQAGHEVSSWSADPYQQDFRVAHDPANGWISIQHDYEATGAVSLKVVYRYGAVPCLAVGNDGHDVVYYPRESGVEPVAYTLAIPALQDWIPDSIPGVPLKEYQAPASWDTTQTLSLMAPDGLGSMVPDDYSTFPHMRLFDWGQAWATWEIFRGHYFWNDADLVLDRMYQQGGSGHVLHANLSNGACKSANSPLWTMADYHDTTGADNHLRTTDERLHTLFMHNLVNRYRPGGLFSRPGAGYQWGSWGVGYYQSEFEANLGGGAGYGYGDFPESEAGLAEKMYRQYQLIKTIDPSLKVISVHATDLSGNGNPGVPGKYVGPDLPFFHKVNETNLPGIPNGGENCDRALWRFCDYLNTSVHCATPVAEDTILHFQDPFVKDTVAGHPELAVGVDHFFWGFYTPGLDLYYNHPGDSTWAPVMTDLDYEKPFFVGDWDFNPDVVSSYPYEDWIASEAVKIFSANVFPSTNPNYRKHYLVEHQNPWCTHFNPQVFEQCAALLNDPGGPGKKFLKAEHLQPVGNNPKVHVYTFCPANYGSTAFASHWINFLRTDYSPPLVADRYVKNPFTYRRASWYGPAIGGYYTGQPAQCFTLSGNQYDKSCNVQTDLLDDVEPHTYYHWYDIPFAAGEIGPQMQMIGPISVSGSANTLFDQSLQLHQGYNLISWQIAPPDPTPLTPLYIPDILPSHAISGDSTWFDSLGGKLYQYNDPGDRGHYPTYPGSDAWEWNLDHAYLITLNGPHLWSFTNRPLINRTSFVIQPDTCWADYHPLSDSTANRWFFIGYEGSGYCKLASLPNTATNLGTPSYYDYEGPFHWLIWDSTNGYQPRVLKIVKDDQGKIYRPTLADYRQSTIDEIGILEPGRGYFLGFRCAEGDTFRFQGWAGSPSWTNTSLEPPGPTAPSYQIASTDHFPFKPYTQWSYPVVIDTIDLGQTPLESGDEIAAFDGELCVGSRHYQGQFPLVLPTWKDDIGTPDLVDGYTPDHSMTFKWYDASANTEAELVLPPGAYAAQDDPEVPTHSGFGRGLYGRRSFASGAQGLVQLPKEYRLGQNYPNPFNSETLIPLELPQRSHLKVELFNLQGQSLGAIWEGVENAGWPKIHYNASALASGVYFYRLSAEGLERGGKFQKVSKMVLLK